MGYRGGKIYPVVYCKLIEIAKKGGTITYGEIGKMMGLPQGNFMGQQVGIICDEINQDEHNYGRPMISSVVVRGDKGRPGKGFFICARSLGKPVGNTTIEEIIF